MKFRNASGCPIVFFQRVFGEKWSILILRDILFRQKRHYQEFLESEEGIATNVLADRLQKLEQEGLLHKSKDPKNLRQFIYAPTEKALDLLPLFIELVLWSVRHDPKCAVPQDAIRHMKKDRLGFIQSLRARFSTKLQNSPS